MDVLFEHVLILLNEDQHLFLQGLSFANNLYQIIINSFFNYSLCRNKSLYKVQLINPNKTASVEQNKSDETTKTTDGLFISLKNIFNRYLYFFLKIFLKNVLQNMVYLQHYSILE